MCLSLYALQFKGAMAVSSAVGYHRRGVRSVLNSSPRPQIRLPPSVLLPGTLNRHAVLGRWESGVSGKPVTKSESSFCGVLVW